MDGVFVFDHLWAIGRPSRPATPAIALLGALCTGTTTCRIGSLVARVGLVPTEVMVSELLTIQHLSSGRLIAGIGTGDSKSAAENLAFGISFEPADRRRSLVRSVGRRLSDGGVEVWVGGGSARTNEVAREEGFALNLWGASPERVRSAAAAAGTGTVTWAGPAPPAGELRSHLERIKAAGASWAVYAWGLDLVELARARGPVER